MIGNVRCAVSAGACASAGSICGKLAGLPIFEGYFVIRILFFVLMISFNTGGMTFFVKALQNVRSSLTASVVSAASNYILSGIAGFCIFGEVTTLVWWTGIFLIICGLVLIARDQQDDKTVPKKSN